jgi:hypothetical protein
MKRVWLIGLALIAATARADHFDEHDGDVIQEAAKSAGVRKVPSLLVRDLMAMPHPLAGSSAGFIVVRTNQGNWSKLLIRHARQKRDGQPVDIVLLDRAVTYSTNVGRRVLADRRGTYLFVGFSIDLDIGQIVPPRMGEDLHYVDEQGGKLIAAEGVKMYLIGKALVEPAAAQPRPQRAGPIQPQDFAGLYRLEADGRWAGKLEIRPDEQGAVSGAYTSEQSGQTYEITGKIGNPTHRIVFTIKFPMAEQKFDGYLWTRGKDRISGVSFMLERPFAFHAQRVD